MTIASIATRSAANRPPATPLSVRHTTGRPVTASPADQITLAALGDTLSQTTNPVRMKSSALAGNSAAARGINGAARSLRPGPAVG